MDRNGLVSRAHAAGLGKFADRIAQTAADCIRLTPQPTEQMTLGASRLGGVPDLEEGLVWPRWQGQSLSFIAQINLADVAAFPVAEALPRTGLLSFFYDADQRTWGHELTDAGSFRVLYSSGLRLQQRPIPEDVPDHGRYAVCSIRFESDISLPPCEWPEISDFIDTMTDDQVDAYIDLIPPGQTQIFGFPTEVQDDVRAEFGMGTEDLSAVTESSLVKQAELLRTPAAEWRLLLQVDSEDAANMMWGDAGLLYYWIPQQALAVHDFERIWMIMQCS